MANNGVARYARKLAPVNANVGHAEYENENTTTRSGTRTLSGLLPRPGSSVNQSPQDGRSCPNGRERVPGMALGFPDR